MNGPPNRFMDERICHKPDLTSRDLEILLLVGEGLQNKEIAGRLDLSMKTVEFHKRRLYSKIGVTGSVGAVRFAIREGYMKA
jgi:DNA-binding NarL/FixJ family response regulator